MSKEESSKQDRNNAFMLACGMLRELVDKETYGSFTVNLEKGRATWTKTDSRVNLPVDLNIKQV